MKLQFTRTQIETPKGVEFGLRCDVDQPDELTARFAHYGIRSPIEFVFEVLHNTMPDGTSAYRTYLTSQKAIDAQAKITQISRDAMGMLMAAEHYSGKETVTL
jgi:hypothetical protein